MKKALVNTIVNYINDNAVEELYEVRDELVAELTKDADRKQANADTYEAVKPIVFGALSETPVTIGELFTEIEDALPEGFTKGKLQYAMTRLWKDEIAKVEGKVNGYCAKA